MSGIVGGPEYRDAMRAKMCGQQLTERQREVLESGRAECGYPPGRYPMPTPEGRDEDDDGGDVPATAAHHRSRPPAAPRDRRPPRAARYTRWMDDRYA